MGCHKRNIETLGVTIGRAGNKQGASESCYGVVVVDVVRKDRTVLK